jgi:hypothetical protein
MGRVEEEATPVGPHGWASPDLRPIVSLPRRGVGFLQADNICRALGTEEIVEVAAGFRVEKPRTVKGTYR